MSITDWVVYSVLALIAVGPLAFPLLKALPLAGRPSQQGWTQHWANLLISLVEELDARGESSAAGIGRDLIWAIIGGDKPKQETKA